MLISRTQISASLSETADLSLGRSAREKIHTYERELMKMSEHSETQHLGLQSELQEARRELDDARRQLVTRYVCVFVFVLCVVGEGRRSELLCHQ